MMPPIKPEPIENTPEMKSRSIKCMPEIISETNGCPPDVKSETIEYTPDIPPTKRLKTLSSAATSPSSKGKAKIEKEDDDSLWEQQLDTCGVCLLEEGMSLRGFIDSCEHYFCFVCIMEWAKIESRCPICKRRFSTIRRLPKDGVFPFERIVNVPVRDQGMDASNWRPTQGGSGAGGDSSMESGDWRAQLQGDSRQRIVNKIMDALKRCLPVSGHEGLQELKRIALRFEEKIYTAATSQSDYLRKISLKMLTMETRSQNPMMQSSYAANSVNDANASLTVVENTTPNANAAQTAVRRSNRIIKKPTKLDDFI